MSAVDRSGGRASADALPVGLARVPVRRILVLSPTIRFLLEPGDRALVAPGEAVLPGTPLAERTPDSVLVDVGSLARPVHASTIAAADSPASQAAAGTSTPADEAAEQSLWRESAALPEAEKPEAAKPEPASPGTDGNRSGPGRSRAGRSASERRRPPTPGKWWVGGGERREPSGRRRGSTRRIAGTLLFELNGRWRAVAGERQEIVEAPVAGVVTEARNGIDITMTVAGAAIPGAVAAGSATRGYLDVPHLIDGELQPRALDVGRSGAVVVAGTRISAEALARARAMSIRGIVTGSIGQGELRDLAASEARQRAGVHQPPPFGVLALEGYLRRPIASPVLALLAALAGHEVAIVPDPPLLIFDMAEVPLPEIPPDWVRVRSGPLAGREGRWLGPAGIHRFRAGVQLEAAFVRLGDDMDPTVVALNDLERFVL